jgi:hypothetical protein
MPTHPKAPFRVLYSNDTTNILSCVSPYHPKRGGPLTTPMIQATVDEAAGADVHMIQPGLCWIPWWKGRRHTAAEHYRWFTETSGQPPDEFGRYILSGNDMVQVFIDRCRLRRQTPFVSFRLNDSQSRQPNQTQARRYGRFYFEHPEYRLGPDPEAGDQRAQNWAIREVREHKFAMIADICEAYDIDGLDLDFLRQPSFFRLHETTLAGRAAIMREFVARVRAVLDRTARGGRRRWLCVRAPCFLQAYERLGVDLPAMVEAGVDMVNLSGFYSTVQQTDLPVVRRMLPNVALYWEMTHTTWNGPSIPGRPDSSPFLRTTEPQLYTGANLAYQRGADGVSLFNFVYYREFGAAPESRGPFNEPPFHVLKRLADAAWLRSQPQWYLLSRGWASPLLADGQLPKTFRQGDRHVFLLDLAPGAHRGPALFRLRSLDRAAEGAWTVRLNGAPLKRVAHVAKPIEHPYNAFLGSPEEFACFACPSGCAGDGVNQLSITLDKGGRMRVVYLDLVLEA